jgi:hypothetical protein
MRQGTKLRINRIIDREQRSIAVGGLAKFREQACLIVSVLDHLLGESFQSRFDPFFTYL